MAAPAAMRMLRLRRPPPGLRLRLPRTATRHASTTEQASQKAADAAATTKATASSLQSRASGGLSRVSSAAGPALGGAARGVGNALGRIGGRTGRLVAAVEAAIPPTIYYSRVGLELGKIVFQGQKMAPPSLATFQSYFAPILHALRNPSSLAGRLSASGAQVAAESPQSVLARLRGFDRAQLAVAGVVAAELLGFFTVGEMLGRLKIVGYRGAVHHEH